MNNKLLQFITKKYSRWGYKVKRQSIVFQWLVFLFLCFCPQLIKNYCHKILSGLSLIKELQLLKDFFPLGIFTVFSALLPIRFISR